jgi:hypothetical protein
LDLVLPCCVMDVAGFDDGDCDKMTWPNKSLQATRDGGSSSASRFTSFGPACLSSGR